MSPTVAERVLSLEQDVGLIHEDVRALAVSVDGLAQEIRTMAQASQKREQDRLDRLAKIEVDNAEDLRKSAEWRRTQGARIIGALIASVPTLFALYQGVAYVAPRIAEAVEDTAIHSPKEAP